jgi:hypothetical protein
MSYNGKDSYLIGKNNKLSECNKVELQHPGPFHPSRIACFRHNLIREYTFIPFIHFLTFTLDMYVSIQVLMIRFVMIETE